MSEQLTTLDISSTKEEKYKNLLPQIEALKGVAEDFVKSISEKTTPLGNANSGLNVVTILEAAQKSLVNRGETIIL